MTPKDMLIRRKVYEDTICMLKSFIRTDAVEAQSCPPPVNLRRATEEDIVPGALIWIRNRRQQRVRFGQSWAIVEEKVDSDRFLSKETIYRLKGSWVEK